MKKIFLIFIFIIFCAIFCLIDAAWLEPNLLISKTKTLYLPHWNKDLNGFKICVISDLHIGSRFVKRSRLEKIVKKANAQNPDLIILPGDFDAQSISESGISNGELADLLNGFKAKYGVFAVMGNHDYKPANVVKDILKKTEIYMLENQSAYLNIDGNILKITGFKDLWHNKLNPEKIIGKTNPAASIIVISHNPDVFPRIPSDVSLTISGHLHGGEVVLPFAGSFTVPSEYGQRYRKGYIVENNKHLYVTGGIATSSNFRFCNPPEIVFLKLYAQTERTKIVNTKPLKGVNKNFIPYYFSFFKKLKSGK